MCFFDSPKAPDIVYQGPSEEDIAANKAQLEAFQAASLKQQEDFMRINPDPTPYDFGYNQLFQLEPNIIKNLSNNNIITPLTIKL